MLLYNKYFICENIARQEENELAGTFHLKLLPECDVYRGHFPGNPVCPGVCNIETIKECAMMFVGQELTITSIKVCRLTAIATPSVCPEIDVTLLMTPTEQGYSINATISDSQRTYMEYKGDLAII